MSKFVEIDIDGNETEFDMTEFVGQRCVFCGKPFQSIKDFDDAVWADTDWRLAHTKCWNANITEQAE